MGMMVSDSPGSDCITAAVCANGASCDSVILSVDGDAAELALAMLDEGSVASCYLIVYASV